MGQLKNLCHSSGKAGRCKTEKPRPTAAVHKLSPDQLNALGERLSGSAYQEYWRNYKAFVPYISFRATIRGLYRYCKRERGRWHPIRRVLCGMRHTAYHDEGKVIPIVDPLKHIGGMLPAAVRAMMDAAPVGSIMELDIQHNHVMLQILHPDMKEHQSSLHTFNLDNHEEGHYSVHGDSPFTLMHAHPEVTHTTHGFGDAHAVPHEMHLHHEHHHHSHHGHHGHGEFAIFFQAFLRIPGLDPYAVCTGGHQGHSNHGHHHVSNHHGHVSHHVHLGHHSTHHFHHEYREHNGHHSHHGGHHTHNTHNGHHEHRHREHHHEHQGHKHEPVNHSHNLHHTHHSHHHEHRDREHHHNGHSSGHHHRPGHNTAKHVRHEQAQWSLRFFDAVWGKKVGMDPTAIAQTAAAKSENAAISASSKPHKVSRYHVLGRARRKFQHQIVTAADAQPPQ